MVGQGSGVEIDELGDTVVEGVVTRCFGIEPHVMAPGFEFVGAQDAPDRLGRNGRHTALVN